MGALHDKWKAAKKSAKKTWESGLTKREAAYYSTGNMSYPLDDAFGSALGDDLDKYEKETKSDKKAALVKTINTKISTYKGEISKQATKLSQPVMTILTNALDGIEGEVE